MSSPKRPADLTTDDLKRLLVTGLADREWHDFTEEEGLDPDAVESWATGYPGERTQGTMFILSRYDDGGQKYALVSSTGVRPEPKQVTTDGHLLAWLWGRVVDGRDDPIPA